MGRCIRPRGVGVAAIAASPEWPCCTPGTTGHRRTPPLMSASTATAADRGGDLLSPALRRVLWLLRRHVSDDHVFNRALADRILAEVAVAGEDDQKAGAASAAVDQLRDELAAEQGRRQAAERDRDLATAQAAQARTAADAAVDDLATAQEALADRDERIAALEQQLAALRDTHAAANAAGEVTLRQKLDGAQLEIDTLRTSLAEALQAIERHHAAKEAAVADQRRLRDAKLEGDDTIVALLEVMRIACDELPSAPEAAGLRLVNAVLAAGRRAPAAG